METGKEGNKYRKLKLMKLTVETGDKKIRFGKVSFLENSGSFHWPSTTRSGQILQGGRHAHGPPRLVWRQISPKPQTKSA